MRAADLPLYYNAVDILERNLASRADQTALVSDARSLTFGQVAAEVNQVGNALRALDLRRGESVALLALDSAEWVCSFFGILKIGAVAASFNTLLTSAEYAYMLRDARARVAIVGHQLLGRIQAVRDELPELKHVVVIGGESDISAGVVSYD